MNLRRAKFAEDEKAAIKEAIRQLQAGVPPAQVRERFRQVLAVISLRIGIVSAEYIAKFK